MTDISTDAQRRFALYEQDSQLDLWPYLPKLKSLAHGTVLEIGTFTGISTAALLAGVEERGGRVTSVDMNYGCAYVWWGHPQWTFLWADSHKLKWPEPIDLLFVDGDHSYGGVSSDLERFGPLAQVIAVHDVCAAQFPGVRQAFDEYVAASGQKVEILKTGAGLGIIQ